MSTKVVKPNDVYDPVMSILREYGDEAFEMFKAVAKKTGRDAVRELKASAPSGGSYARGWSHKAQQDGVTQYTDIIYNRTDYQLTHLLEYPHPTGFGEYPTHVDYTGNIARVEEKYSVKFYEGIVEKL